MTKTRRVKFEFDDRSLVSIEKLKQQGSFVMPMEYMNDRARAVAQGQYPVDPEFMRAFSAPKEKSDLVEIIESMEKEVSDLRHQIGMVRATMCVNYTQPRSQDGIVIDDLQASTIDMLVEVLKGYNKKLTETKGLLDRSMAIVTEAIMHGMPITPEVAAVRNEWVQV